MEKRSGVTNTLRSTTRRVSARSRFMTGTIRPMQLTSSIRSSRSFRFASARFAPITAHEFQAKFHWHVEDQGIRHAYIRPASPQLNGKVERSHRTDEQEFTSS